MTNRPEWMLDYFRSQIRNVMDENSHQDEVVEELALLLTRYALMPPETAKQQVEEGQDD